ncbi:MAG TPA: hypothetical protein VK059_13595 [Nocardioidaceae bacterium]|nr:hypothetical protein [Nocardioidaceae bacterium]
MNIAFLFLIAVASTVAIAAMVIGYVRFVRNDGYGHRPTPSSHRGQTVLGR